MDIEYDEKTIKYLQLLSQKYPTIQSVASEIINLRAIMNLPKGTEHYISDIHGEYEGFRHILRNASGSVRSKIDQTLGDFVSSADRKELAALIYYPELKLKKLRNKKLLTREWYMLTIPAALSSQKMITAATMRYKTGPLSQKCTRRSRSSSLSWKGRPLCGIRNIKWKTAFCWIRSIGNRAQSKFPEMTIRCLIRISRHWT